MNVFEKIMKPQLYSATKIKQGHPSARFHSKILYSM